MVMAKKGLYSLRIETYDHQCPQGTLDHFDGHRQHFSSLVQLIELVATDLAGEGRTDGTPVLDARDVFSRRSTDSLASFRLRVLFCRHGTWQGLLCWHETGQNASFRSIFELVRLLDYALRLGRFPESTDAVSPAQG